jgi:hypothetical protein
MEPSTKSEQKNIMNTIKAFSSQRGFQILPYNPVQHDPILEDTMEELCGQGVERNFLFERLDVIRQKVLGDDLNWAFKTEKQVNRSNMNVFVAVAPSTIDGDFEKLHLQIFGIVVFHRYRPLDYEFAQQLLTEDNDTKNLDIPIFVGSDQQDIIPTNMMDISVLCTNNEIAPSGTTSALFAYALAKVNSIKRYDGAIVTTSQQGPLDEFNALLQDFKFTLMTAFPSEQTQEKMGHSLHNWVNNDLDELQFWKSYQIIRPISWWFVLTNEITNDALDMQANPVLGVSCSRNYEYNYDNLGRRVLPSNSEERSNYCQGKKGFDSKLAPQNEVLMLRKRLGIGNNQKWKSGNIGGGKFVEHRDDVEETSYLDSKCQRVCMAFIVKLLRNLIRKVRLDYEASYDFYNVQKLDKILIGLGFEGKFPAWDRKDLQAICNVMTKFEKKQLFQFIRVGDNRLTFRLQMLVIGRYKPLIKQNLEALCAGMNEIERPLDHLEMLDEKVPGADEEEVSEDKEKPIEEVARQEESDDEEEEVESDDEPPAMKEDTSPFNVNSYYYTNYDDTKLYDDLKRKLSAEKADITVSKDQNQWTLLYQERVNDRGAASDYQFELTKFKRSLKKGAFITGNYGEDLIEVVYGGAVRTDMPPIFIMRARKRLQIVLLYMLIQMMNDKKFATDTVIVLEPQGGTIGKSRNRYTYEPSVWNFWTQLGFKNVYVKEDVTIQVGENTPKFKEVKFIDVKGEAYDVQMQCEFSIVLANLKTSLFD